MSGSLRSPTTHTQKDARIYSTSLTSLEYGRIWQVSPESKHAEKTYRDTCERFWKVIQTLGENQSLLIRISVRGLKPETASLSGVGQ